jgi:hypothetical protein
VRTAHPALASFAARTRRHGGIQPASFVVRQP